VVPEDEPAPVPTGTYVKAADEALARAQTLSMMLTGEALTPRLQLPVTPGADVGGRATTAASGGALTLSGVRARRRRASGASQAPHDRAFWFAILVPLVVFAGLLVAIAFVPGEATRALLAIGAIITGIVGAVLPAFFRGDRSAVDPREAKDVLDVMAGAILALRGEVRGSGAEAEEDVATTRHS
jgi:hypothetical protein